MNSNASIIAICSASILARYSIGMLLIALLWLLTTVALRLSRLARRPV